jgi:hypothetical protein
MDSEFKVYKHPNSNCWFIAEPVSGTILINNCRSLDAAIQARQSLISRLQAVLRRNFKPMEADTNHIEPFL